MLTPRRASVAGSAGFTLIELVVAMAIFSILVALAVPAFRTWVTNVKIRAAADNLQNGLRTAQTESLRRSRQVVFALTNTATPASGFTAVANGNYWAIQTIPAMLDGSEAPVIVQTGVINSGGTIVSISGPAEVCFNSAGRLVANGTTGVAGGTCALPTTTANSAPTQIYNLSLGNGTPLRVQLGLGGQLHLCDPSQTLSSSNPYGC